MKAEERVLEEVDEHEREAKNNEECPRCRTTRMRQPNLKLYVGTCGHSLCEVCLNHVFHNTPSYPCIVCRALRLRADYAPKLFEDGEVHRSVVIRKEKLKDLNLSLDDFGGNVRKYNDYLEMKEDIVYNLEHNIDVTQTRQILARFIERHRDAIAANKRRIERERHRQLQQKREQARIERARQEAKLQELRRQKESKEKLRQQILEQLASSDDPRKTLLKGKQALLERQRAQMSMFRDTSHTYTEGDVELSFDHELPTARTYPVFRYKTPYFNMHGPHIPATPALKKMKTGDGAVSADQAATGGMDRRLVLKRAIQDAFSCLFEH